MPAIRVRSPTELLNLFYLILTYYSDSSDSTDCDESNRKFWSHKEFNPRSARGFKRKTHHFTNSCHSPKKKKRSLIYWSQNTQKSEESLRLLDGLKMDVRYKDSYFLFWEIFSFKFTNVSTLLRQIETGLKAVEISGQSFYRQVKLFQIFTARWLLANFFPFSNLNNTPANLYSIIKFYFFF